MAAWDAEIAHAIADAADVFNVPIYGLAGMLHETLYRERGHALIPEFFVDLNYDEGGNLIITRHHPPVPPQIAVERTVDAVSRGRIVSDGGREHPQRVETICLHSDTPNAVEIAKAVSATLEDLSSQTNNAWSCQ